MSDTQKLQEALGQNPDSVKLLQDLDTMDTDQKKFTHLRNLFLEEADVDEYVRYLDTDEDIDLTRKQLSKLKGVLEGYKVYLKRYLEKSAGRIGSLDERLKKSAEELANPELTPEEVDNIAHTRKRVAQAMQIAKAPRGAKGRNLREVTQKGATSASESKTELSPEQVESWLGELKTRFDALPQLHEGVKFADVEKSLKADPESMWKLHALDEKGHKMSVFGEENGEFIFASGWENYKEVSPDHRNITYDTEGQKLAEKQGYKPNGNAVSIIARIMGVNENEAGNYLADPKFHEQLIKAIAVNGWAWLKTDAATRKSGDALGGSNFGIYRNGAAGYSVNGSFRAALRVKKA